MILDIVFIKVKDNNVIWKKMIINNKKRNRGRFLD